MLVVPQMGKAQGNLIIIPRRIVFEDRKRIQELNLANTGTDTAKFLVSIIQYRMKTDGNFESVTEPDSGQRFADKNLRFFPRSVTLAPNEAQTIKVQLVGTQDMLDGEYRSHLYFRAVPTVTLDDKVVVGKEKEISVHLTPIFGIAIPVIIRVGNIESKINMSATLAEAIKTGIFTLRLNFVRSGESSVYGDLKVEHKSPDGKMTTVGIARGLAVYTPNTERSFVLELNTDKNINYHKGSILISYTNEPGKIPSLIAKAELKLN